MNLGNKDTSEPKRILFFAEGATLAHVARPLLFASDLALHGYQVFIAVSEEYQELAKKYLLTCDSSHGTPSLCTLFSQSSSDFLTKIREKRKIFDYELIHKYIHSDISIIKSIRPDLVIGDFRPSLTTSAQLCNVPSVSLCNAYWNQDYVYTYRSALVEFLFPHWPKFLAAWAAKMCLPILFRLELRPFNSIRKSYRLPPYRGIFEMYESADLLLYTDSSTLFKFSNNQSADQFLGPISWNYPHPLPSWFPEVQNKKFVYLCLGSSGETSLLPQVIEVLTQQNLSVVVAGGKNCQIPHRPPLCYVADFLPGDAVAQSALLVICNGGSLSVYQALLHGLPVVGICSNTEQYLSMRIIQKNNLGFAVRAHPFKLNEFADALNKACDPLVRQTALEIKKKFLLENPLEKLRQNLNKLFVSEGVGNHREGRY